MDEELERTLLEEEKRLEEEEPVNIIPPDNIFTYSESRSCADITRMVSEGNLKRDPFFQRNDVWSNADKTRFIDSLLKRMPIPSMCFSVDSHEKYNVIDGRQRTSTIVEFINALENDETSERYFFSDLKDVDNRIAGKNLLKIKKDTPEIVTIIKNATIPINMLKCNYDLEDNMQYIFKIFHRLNSGGIKLNNQEIRNCIYSGDFNDLLNELNSLEEWKRFVPRIADNERLKGCERILNFFSFYYYLEEYKGSMSSFLNINMERFSKENSFWIKKQRDLFTSVIRIAINIDIQNYQKNVYIDAVLYGIAKNLTACEKYSKEQIQLKFNQLLCESSFKKENLKEGIAKKENLRNRFDSATKIFA